MNNFDTYEANIAAAQASIKKHLRPGCSCHTCQRDRVYTAAMARLVSSDFADGGKPIVHVTINALCRWADNLASRVADSALDSSCTDVRPAAGARKQLAWDAVWVAHELNRRTAE
jgi:hypothetical protein